MSNKLKGDNMNHYSQTEAHHNHEEARSEYHHHRRIRKLKIYTFLILGFIAGAFVMYLLYHPSDAQTMREKGCTQLPSRAVGDDPKDKSPIWSCPEQPR